jgi:hydroxymethylpyrimidine pyrophosphatase-like HAD family hydrolase
MKFSCLSCDYDGTIAHDGKVAPSTIAALRRFAAANGTLLLVTGREIPDLLKIFPENVMFDRIVAENGALLYDPATRNERLLAPPPSEFLVNELRRRGIQMSVGRAIIATWRPNVQDVADAIRETKQDVRVILNKNAVMILPPGIDKASGLRVALSDLRIAPENVVGVGDAENDLDFLAICGAGVAVANALPEVKSKVAYVTHGDHGAGVEELVNELLSGSFNS